MPLTALEQAEYELLTRMEADEAERVACEGSLIQFLRCAWSHIGESGAFEINWHHEKIAEHLEAVAYGEVRALVDNQPPRTTKALDCDTPILTTWGWKRHGDLAPGDFVFGPDGLPKRVLGISPQAIKPAYEVLFDDRASIVASGDHLWSVERDHPYGGPGSTRCRKVEIVTTDEMRPAAACRDGVGDEGERKRNLLRPDRIACAASLSMGPRRLLIDPYLLGAWLGDGSTTGGTLYVGWQDINHFAQFGKATEYSNGDNRPLWHVLVPELQTKLRVLGLLGNKHVPADYLEASIEQRWDLLRGLMDTDGCASTRDGVCSYVSKLPNLAADVQQLACSLGLKAALREIWSSINDKRCGPYYQITFVAAPEMPPIFRLSRKQACVRTSQNARSRGRYLQSVTAVGHRLVNCIKVEGNLYLAGRQFVCTHNTLLCSVAFPAWVWAQPEDRWGPLMGPHVKFFCLSYGATLAEEIAVKMRRLVMGEWYQKHWGKQVQILADQSSRANFGNAAGGERLSNSIEGGILGRGGDIQLIDDPHSTKGVESLLMRQSTIDGMRSLTTRITDPRRTARVLIMQRLHQGDATDYALKNWGDDVVHLCFPMRYEADSNACSADIRTREGELLWPKVFTDAAVAQMEKELLEYGAAGQLQQRPIPRGGGIIKREWLQPWPPWNADGTFPHDMVRNGRIQYPALEYVVGWVDTAYTEKQQNDPSAMIVLGVFRAEGKGRIERRGDGSFVRVADDYGFPKVLLLYGWQKRLTLQGPPEEMPNGVTREEWASLAFRQQRQENWGLVQWVADSVKRYRVDYLGIETQAAGHSLEQELRRVHSDLPCSIETQPAKGDKWARLYSVSGLISSEQVYVPTYEDGTHPTWAEPLITELVMFPRAEHDEAVDTFSGALKHLRETAIFERREEFDRGEERSMMWQTNRRVSLPYDL